MDIDTLLSLQRRIEINQTFAAEPLHRAHYFSPGCPHILLIKDPIGMISQNGSLSRTRLAAMPLRVSHSPVQLQIVEWGRRRSYWALLDPVSNSTLCELDVSKPSPFALRSLNVPSSCILHEPHLA